MTNLMATSKIWNGIMLEWSYDGMLMNSLYVKLFHFISIPASFRSIF